MSPTQHENRAKLGAGSRDPSSTRLSKPSKPSKVQGSKGAWGGRGGAEGEEAFKGFEGENEGFEALFDFETFEGKAPSLKANVLSKRKEKSHIRTLLGLKTKKKRKKQTNFFH